MLTSNNNLTCVQTGTMKKNILFCICLIFSCLVHAQFPGAPGGARPGGGQNMNIGHFYGKLVDSISGKGLEAASVQLVGNKFDTATKKLKQVILATVLTQANGDFSLENLPVFGNFKLRIRLQNFSISHYELTSRFYYYRQKCQ